MTLPQLFNHAVDRFTANTLMLEHDGESYKPLKYSEMRDLVNAFASGLLKLGIQKGDRLAMLAEGRNAWVVSELGILFAGAVNVPLSVFLVESSELIFRLRHSGCRMAVVSGRQISKVRDIRAELPELELVILMDDTGDIREGEMLYDDVLAMGRQELLGDEGRVRLEKAWTSVGPNDMANICYTSGTTADPKAIMLTHRNYTANIEQATSIMEVPDWWCSLMILPWDHSFAHTVGLYTLINNGASIAAVQQGKTQAETIRNIPNNIKESKPTFLLTVPALTKNFRNNIEREIRAKGKTIASLFDFAMRNAYKLNRDGWDKGKGFQLHRRILNALFDRILFSKIRQGFGGRLQFIVGGGALLDIDLQRFFYAIGMPVYQGYGLTEAAPIISGNAPHRHKLGSSGFIVKDLEVRICDDEGRELAIGRKGEIVVRGENVMAGYYKNEEATRDTIRDGWLYTGDMGYLDEDGFLYVLGRFKSLLIANDGEKYSPEGIEEALVNHSDLLDQVMLYNNQNAYTTALFVPRADGLKRALSERGVDTGSADMPDKAITLLREEVARYLGGGEMADMFPDRWVPSAFAVVDEPFSKENKCINSQMKLVRMKVNEHYADRIAHLYTPEGKDPFNDKNRKAILEILK